MTAARLEEAAEHVKKGRWAKAIDAFRAVLADEPENVELRVALAETYKKAKNSERAFHHFHRAAMLYLSKSDPVRAFPVLLEANALAPNTPEVLWRLCECFKAVGRIDEAVPHLVALIKSATAQGDRRRLWALEELFLLHPDDLSVAQQRAEALYQADLVDQSVDAYKKLAARLGKRPGELTQVLFRAAKIASGRPELGADLASVLLAHGLVKESLAVIVGFYEKAPDNVAVLEALVRALEAMGAKDKAIAARVELVKARAATGARAAVTADVEQLLEQAPDNAMALEVAAHALVLVRESTRAADAWRRLMRLAERRGLLDARDRAVHQVLKLNPDDEEALELALAAHANAGRSAEADVVRKRIAAVRSLRRRSMVPQHSSPRSSAPAPSPRPSSPSAPSLSAPSLSAPSLSAPSLSRSTPAFLSNVPVQYPEHETAPEESVPSPEELVPTGTLVLSDSDVVDIRGHKAPLVPAPDSERAFVPSLNPWFAGHEERPADLSADEWVQADPDPDPSTLTVEHLETQAGGPRGSTTRGRSPAARRDTAADDPFPPADIESTEEPTTMDAHAMAQLRALTQTTPVLVSDAEDGPSLPGELTHAGPTVRAPVRRSPIPEELADEP